MADQKRFVAKNGLDNNNQTIQQVADPVNPQDASTKAFSSNASNLASGTMPVGRMPALTGGDVTSTAGSGSLALTNTGVAAGTYKSLTVDAKGRVTGGTNPTTLGGFGITDAVNSSEVVTVATPSKLLKLDANSKLPASITGNADGNAATASKLQTPRTINGVSFDGSANITVNAVDSTARIASSEKAAANGVATLDAAGNVPFAQLGNVVSTAPVALNTLAKLATALNNDPNAYATLTGLMDSKVAAAKSDLIGTASSSLNSFGEVEAAISTEEAARIAGDTVLQSNIDALDASIAAQMGAANGIATLGSDGKVPAAQLPSYVDDVLEFADQAGFPATGETGKIYVAKDTNKTYRWSGSAYVYITSGAVDSVAGKTGVVVLVKGDVGLANVDNTADAVKNVLSATKLTTARTLSLSGDASGSASFDGSANAAISMTLANSGVTAGTYPKVTVDAKGRVTAGAALAATDVPSLDWSKITTGKPTTLSGYGITDAATSTHNHTVDGLSNVTITTKANGDTLTWNGLAWVNTTQASLTAGNATKLATARTLGLSGDASGSAGFDGSANATIAVTLANSGVTAGTYKSVTVDAKGRVTGGTNPTTLAGYGITDAQSLIAAGTASQYYRGDKTWATLDKTAVGLGSVENTALSTWAGSSNLTTAGALTAASLTVTGALVVHGTTTTVNSTSVTLDDPVMTLGGDVAPTVDDGKDRGIEFRWHNGTAAKVGFFGFDDSTGKLTFIPDATNTSEVFTGTKGTLDAYLAWADVTGKPTTLAGYGITDAVSSTGTAAAATKLATARTIGMTGDVTWTSAAFDGTANVTASATLANSGVTAGTYKSVTVDAKGRVTAGTNPTTLAGYGITDAASSTHTHTTFASLSLTGVPTAPTAAVNTNTTQIATTAFVVAQIAANGGAGAAIDGGTF